MIVGAGALHRRPGVVATVLDIMARAVVVIGEMGKMPGRIETRRMTAENHTPQGLDLQYPVAIVVVPEMVQGRGGWDALPQQQGKLPGQMPGMTAHQFDFTSLARCVRQLVRHRAKQQQGGQQYAAKAPEQARAQGHG